MSGRGARSRKAIEKNIKKEEKKHPSKGLSSAFSRAQSPSRWSIHSRGSSTPLGRSASRTGTTSSNSRPPTGHSDQRRSLASPNKGPAVDRSRSKNSGKRLSVNSSQGSYKVDAPEFSMSGALGLKSAGNGMTYLCGKGRRGKLFKGLEQDHDMWIKDGDCLIYFVEGVDEDNVRPLLRVHTRELRNARSTFLNNLLGFGKIASHQELSPPPSSHGSETDCSNWPLRGSVPNSPTDYLRPSLWGGSDRLSVLQRGIDSRVPSGLPDQFDNHRFGSMLFPSPPLSQSPSDKASSAAVSSYDSDITHEIWFPSPKSAKTADARFRHRIAVRNFLALLYNKPIVGSDFYETISELHKVANTVYEFERRDTVKILVDYILAQSLDDVRGNLRHALGLLAWSEQPDVHWEEGYMEAFVHATGMMTDSAYETREFKRLSMATRASLTNAYNAMQLKLLEAEEKLTAFDLSDFWAGRSGWGGTDPGKSFEDFRQYLFQYMNREYRQWPLPPLRGGGRWLTRKVVRKLQQDFGLLYDYLVNRDVSWNDPEKSPSGKLQMVCKVACLEDLDANRANFPVDTMVINFDNRNGYLHIPHPYPLLPQSVDFPKPQKAHQAKRVLFSGLRRNKSLAQDSKSSERGQRVVDLAYSEANNLNKLGTALENNAFVDSFDRYEREAHVTELAGVNPRDARLSRWMLMYGILQILSTLSIEVEGLKYREGVNYFVCPLLKGCPPWHTTRKPMEEATQESSYCWTAPQRWLRVRPQTRSYSSFGYYNTHEPKVALNEIVNGSAVVRKNSAGDALARTHTDDGDVPLPLLPVGSVNNLNRLDGYISDAGGRKRSDASGRAKPSVPPRSPKRGDGSRPSTASGNALFDPDEFSTFPGS